MKSSCPSSLSGKLWAGSCTAGLGQALCCRWGYCGGRSALLFTFLGSCIPMAGSSGRCCCYGNWLCFKTIHVECRDGGTCSAACLRVHPPHTLPLPAACFSPGSQGFERHFCSSLGSVCHILPGSGFSLV